MGMELKIYGRSTAAYRKFHFQAKLNWYSFDEKSVIRLSILFYWNFPNILSFVET